jgi:tetratricopeptide (TPR) repeat protein
MNRFSSLEYVPTQTRILLRSRFARNLPSHRAGHFGGEKGNVLDDELLLHFLLNLNIDVARDFEKAKITYLEAYPLDSDEPSIDELISQGWIRVIWGRIFIPSEIARFVRSKEDDAMSAFVSLYTKIFDEEYHLTNEVRCNPIFANIVAAVDNKDDRTQSLSCAISCQSPEWVAVRLWDRSFDKSPDINATLRTWVDRWRLLMYPSFQPERVWNETVADTFREAVINLLETEQGIMRWDQIRSRFINQMALAQGQEPSSYEKYIPPIPATLVSRVLWLEDHRLERYVMWALEACNDICGLVRLLLSDVEIEESALPPHKIVSKLIALSIERPELLLAILFKVRSNAVLLADLLFCPETSALACLLVAQWQFPSSAWDRELIIRDDHAAKAIAFTDAVSVMGYFLRQGAVPPEEVSALLDCLHSNVLRYGIEEQGNSENMLAILRSELISQSSEVLHPMLAALTASMPDSGIGTSEFSAALDIINVGNLASEVDPVPVINAYIQSVTSDNYSLSANRVSVEEALSLFELSKKMSDQGQSFLFPFDIKQRIKDGNAVNDNEYTVEGNVIRSVRVHIRILSRAVAGYKESLPEELLKALITAVHNGAIKHEEKGRVAAFSASYESSFQDKSGCSIAIDLSNALRAVNDTQRSQLLNAILEIDEPIVLARLLPVAPYSTRKDIENRITELTPDEASEIHSLTEMQARIEALLSVGAVDAAAQYIEVEKDLKTLGKVPGREMVRLRALLHLQFLKSDWDGIAGAELPVNLFPIEKDPANDTIRFYQALAELRKPNGNLESAEYWFSQLQKRHPQVVAYASNLFATQLSRLFNGDLFVQLYGKQVADARLLLNDAEQMMSRTQGMSPADSDIFNANKVLILLAMGQPEQADILLRHLLAARLQDNFSAYSAIALSRMGRTPEAITILDHAEKMLGSSDILITVRSKIISGTPYLASVNIILKDDRVRSIKAALFDLSRMDSMDQAAVLNSAPEPFDEFVIEVIRMATASVVFLVPMMKNMVIDSCEDDLSAFIRELLIPRFSLLGWSCPDQPKGGYSKIGNSGERDLVIKRDNYELAVIEAVVCKSPPNWSNLKSHFQKLLGYSTCRLFFHLTYSYIKNPASIVSKLKEFAEHNAPTGFSFMDISDIPLTDSRPAGFFARYNAEFEEVKVVFLVLNLGQHHQKGAAKIAGG